MPTFRITAANKDGRVTTFYYDNEQGRLTNSMNVDVVPPKIEASSRQIKESVDFSIDKPIIGKTPSKARRIKLQLGLTCNYSCSYCSQKFVERSDEISMKYVDDFMEKFLDRFPQAKPGGRGLKIELWGGEPLVYWKVIKKLVPGLREITPNVKFSMITNGSLLDMEKAQFILDYNIALSMSHDGPFQHLRGDDPMDNPVVMQALHHIIDTRKRGFSVNPVYHIENFDRRATIDWIHKKLGRNVYIGESDIISAYDPDGKGKSIPVDKMQEVARKLYEGLGKIGFDELSIRYSRYQVFRESLEYRTKKLEINQHCGLDQKNSIAMTMAGNLLTCQNGDVTAIADNGVSHLLGHVDNPEEAVMASGTHWKSRTHCSMCPVLVLCGGGCLINDGQNFSDSCNNNYVDYIASFADAFTQLTGCTMVTIEADHLPPERRDPFGFMGLKPVVPVKKRMIPIKAI